MFWMNGKIRDIDTLELFSNIRILPEPIPLDFIVWAAPTARLAGGTGSQWSAVLKRDLLNLLAEIYRHHEGILMNKDDKSPLLDIHKELDSQCSEIKILIRLTDITPISVWTTEVEGLEEVIELHSTISQLGISQLMKFPHIARLLEDSNLQVSSMQREVNRLEGGFNKTRKLLKRGRWNSNPPNC